MLPSCMKAESVCASLRHTGALFNGGLAVDKHVNVGVDAGRNADVAGQARPQVAHGPQQPLLRRCAEPARRRKLPRMSAEAPALPKETDVRA